MKYLLLLVPLLAGCTFDCHIELDLLAAVTPKPTSESRDGWLDAQGRVLAQEHGWTLTMLSTNPATPTVAYYHMTRSLVPLPAEKP